jgi:hypothetical protein
MAGEKRKNIINDQMRKLPEISTDNGISNVYNNSDAADVKSVGKRDNSLLTNPRIALVKVLVNIF